MNMETFKNENNENLTIVEDFQLPGESKLTFENGAGSSEAEKNLARTALDAGRGKLRTPKERVVVPVNFGEDRAVPVPVRSPKHSQELFVAEREDLAA